MRIRPSAIAITAVAGACALGVAAASAVGGAPHAASARPASPDAALTALLRPSSAGPGDPIFMFINGIPGESAAAGHAKWIEVSAYHTSFSQSVPSTGGGAGKAVLGSFVVTTPYSIAVPPLLHALVTGRHFPTVKIQAATPGPKRVMNYLTITLTNVGLSAINESSAGERPTETLTFQAAQLAVSYVTAGGQAAPPFCFNFATQRAC
jgi:type VI protein secretion system component Hcp